MNEEQFQRLFNLLSQRFDKLERLLAKEDKDFGDDTHVMTYRVRSDGRSERIGGWSPVRGKHAED